MSWLKRNVGLDWFDLLIHAGVTGMLLVMAGMENSEEVMPVIMVGSLLVLAVRRKLALRSAERKGLTPGEMATMRIAELEDRVAELEAAQADVAELAERLDFAERLLAQPPADRAIQRGSLQ